MKEGTYTDKEHIYDVRFLRVLLGEGVLVTYIMDDTPTSHVLGVYNKDDLRDIDFFKELKKR